MVCWCEDDLIFRNLVRYTIEAEIERQKQGKNTVVAAAAKRQLFLLASQANACHSKSWQKSCTKRRIDRESGKEVEGKP